MNNVALALQGRVDEQVPPEQQGFVPTFVRKWPVVEVNRPRIRASLHPDVVKSEGVWGSVDPRVKAFAAQIKGNDIEKVECRLFRWGIQEVSIGEAAWRIGRKEGPRGWVPALFEHLVAYGRAIPLSELRSIIVAPGTTVTMAEPPRPVFRGNHAEASNDVCMASILGGAPLKMLNISVLAGEDPVKFKFPKRTLFLGVRRVC
jgi:hypothetical protein